MTKGKRSRCCPSSPTDARTSSARTSPAVRQASVVWRRHVRGERRPYGYSNVIDITDETNPRIVSKIMLEVHDPKNCAKFLSEPPEVGGGILDYSTERCALDRPKNPTMAACGSRGTGTRVYDIRDPLHPAEIAYWKGPAPRTAFLPGSGSWSPTVDRTVEKQAGLARFVKVRAANGKGHELNLWIVGDAGGFQVLRFTDEFLQTKPGKAIHAEALRGLGRLN